MSIDSSVALKKNKMFLFGLTITKLLDGKRGFRNQSFSLNILFNCLGLCVIYFPSFSYKVLCVALIDYVNVISFIRASEHQNHQELIAIKLIWSSDNYADSLMLNMVRILDQQHKAMKGAEISQHVPFKELCQPRLTLNCPLLICLSFFMFHFL